MVNRLLKPLKSKSLLLFGVRGVGKSTFLKKTFPSETAVYFDLLDPETLDDLRLNPARFKEMVLANPSKIILVDEIQRLPILLDYVHSFIESHNIRFVLTGSSARRLKQKGVNLLAGRALVYDLFPFTTTELGDRFNLQRALEIGGLPGAYLATTDEETQEYLRSYALTYLEKEIQQEQWVRKLDPFRKFLQVAAQMNGKIINRSLIARDIGVDDMTVESYFEILEDTLMGFRLPGFHRSSRKQFRKASKFYWIDPGIKRSLDKTLRVPLLPQTSAFGEAFEHWVILEFFKLSRYRRLDWDFYFANTPTGAEIDLVIKRPGKPYLLVEIKSKSKVHEADAKNLTKLGNIIDKKAECLLVSLDPLTQHFGKTKAIHWLKALECIE